MRPLTRCPKALLASAVSALMVAGVLATSAVESGAVTTGNTLDLKVLLIGDGSTDPTTAAWESALAAEGAPYTEVDATGTAPDQDVALPALSSGTTGFYNGVVVAGSPTDFAAGELSSLDAYESTFGVRQVDGYMYPDPSLGATDATSGSLDGTTGQLTAAGLTDFPELAGPIPFATCPTSSGTICTYGYSATVGAGAPYTSIINNTAGDSLAGIYQHGSTLPGTSTADPQDGVSELSLFFDYNAADIQWLLLAPGLINWVTQGTHLGEYRNYVEMDIDDTFTPDDAWDTTTHENDYSVAGGLRMTPEDVVTSAEWSQQNHFRLDQLFNFGSSVAAQAGELDFAGSENDSGVATPDPLLAQFQATDPATGKPYADDFGWISHTYDTPVLDVGCATENYIEAELNENTTSIAAAPGATAGTGGLGITSSTDDTQTYGYEDPDVFVPGNHSGFADLVPGNPATVDAPDLDSAEVVGSGATAIGGAGTAAAVTTGLPEGDYEYAVTDQFNAAAVTAGVSPDGESAAYVTTPIEVQAGQSVQLTWQSVCHAANYNIYREDLTTNSGWQLIGTYFSPFSATLPDSSSADTTGGSSTNVAGGGETELTFTDAGGSSPECEGSAGGYCPAAIASAPWTTPPVTEDAEESPWESNPYFAPALQAVGITAVGDDGSKPYPDPPDTQFGYGTTYTGAEYAAGRTFLEDGQGDPDFTSNGTWPGAQVVPRHPLNIYFDVSTDAQELDEYNTLFTSTAEGGECTSSSTTTCYSPAEFTFADVVDSIVSQMLDFMLTNNPEPSYVHQTNLIGILPGCADTTWATDADGCGTPPSTTCDSASCMPATPDTTGDGTLYSVLDPLLSDYESYFNDNVSNSGTTPYLQLTEGEIASVLAYQSAWSSALTTGDVSASETGGSVTITNTGSALEVPVTVPSGTANSTVLTQYGGGLQYGGDLSGWVELGTGSSNGSSVALGEAVAPTITSAISATSNVGSAFSFEVTTTGAPTPVITENASTLPAGLAFTDNGNGTATIAGTPAAGSGGSYPVTITASNSAGSVNQSFTLTNLEAPTITSSPSATFTTTVAGNFEVTTTGYPVALSETGTLPSGLTFSDNGNGTGTIGGTPASGSQGSYPLTITASNSEDDSSVSQSLTLTVDLATAPALTVPSADFTLGQTGSVAVTATGYPTPSITETGGLPAGLNFVDNGNGAATLSGTPTANGTTDLTVSATNAIGTVSQTMVVEVGEAAAITSADNATATVGSAFSFVVTTSGYPTPALVASGLPTSGDLTFTDDGNGTATIAGTPTAADEGTYSVDITADNLYNTAPAQQSFTLTIGEPPTFTSASSTTFTAGAAGSFTVSASGYPTPSLGYTGTLPAGVSFVDNGNGTATISGTPTGTGGTYNLTLSAANSASATATQQAFTLTVDAAPTITSGSTANFTEGTAGSFAVTATGYPTPSFTATGLPLDLTFTDNGNGTATIAGTPGTADEGNTYDVSITASNGVSPAATQTLALTVGGAMPAFTSAASATFTSGSSGSFLVSASGSPAPAITESGALPAGVTFSDASGSGTLAGTPSSSTGGVYSIELTATNSLGTTTQAFTLTVDQAPVVTSSGSTTFAAGTAGSFSVETTGYPLASVTGTGALPNGVTFVGNSNGTATLAGTPAAGTQGTYPITITAANGVSPNATQSFTLTVNSGLAITSASSATATAGTAFSFTVTATGTPTPTLTRTGTLPAGITFTANSNGTATLAGTPSSSDSGVYSLTFTAKNSTGTTSQAFTLTVDKAPTFSSAASVTETAGVAFSFAISTTGYPTPALSSGALPTGVTLTDNGNGTATLSGTAAVAAATYAVTLTATNSAGSANQSFTLTVKAAGTKVPVPTFTSAGSATATAGQAFSFTVTTAGSPTTTYTTNVTHTGTLPAGLSFDNLGNGEATISGTPTATSGGVYTLTLKATNSAGTTTQTFVLTVDAAPTITSAASSTATDGSAFDFTVKTTGAPAPSLTESGGLPSGLTFTDNGNGTATVSGTPGVDQGGVYTLTITATNSLGSATQSFRLTVDQAPAITSAPTANATHGVAFSFTFTSTSYPLASVTHSGSVPGLRFTNNGNGTATLSGTPTKAGTYTLTIKASNSVGTATQTFTLTVS